MSISYVAVPSKSGVTVRPFNGEEWALRRTLPDGVTKLQVCSWHSGLQRGKLYSDGLTEHACWDMDQTCYDLCWQMEQRQAQKNQQQQSTVMSLIQQRGNNWRAVQASLGPLQTLIEQQQGLQQQHASLVGLLQLDPSKPNAELLALGDQLTAEHLTLSKTQEQVRSKLSGPKKDDRSKVSSKLIEAQPVVQAARHRVGLLSQRINMLTEQIAHPETTAGRLEATVAELKLLTAGLERAAQQPYYLIYGLLQQHRQLPGFIDRTYHHIGYEIEELRYDRSLLLTHFALLQQHLPGIPEVVYAALTVQYRLAASTSRRLEAEFKASESRKAIQVGTRSVLGRMVIGLDGKPRLLLDDDVGAAVQRLGHADMGAGAGGSWRR